MTFVDSTLSSCENCSGLRLNISWGFHGDFHGIFMGNSLDFHGVFMGFSWEIHGGSMGFPNLVVQDRNPLLSGLLLRSASASLRG